LGALGSAKVQGTLLEVEDELFEVLPFGLEPANAESVLQRRVLSGIVFDHGWGFFRMLATRCDIDFVFLKVVLLFAITGTENRGGKRMSYLSLDLLAPMSMLLLLFDSSNLVGMCYFCLALVAVVALYVFEFLEIGARIAGTSFNFFRDLLHLELHEGELFGKATQHLSFDRFLIWERAVHSHNGHVFFWIFEGVGHGFNNILAFFDDCF
jgi:hypothetical protein